jgi:hypothetical protein
VGGWVCVWCVHVAGDAFDIFIVIVAMGSAAARAAQVPSEVLHTPGRGVGSQCIINVLQCALPAFAIALRLLEFASEHIWY